MAPARIARLRIGVSSCLLGHAVRYDGGHKRAPFLRTAFGSSVDWVPVCPEVELGLGVPRDPVRLEIADAGGGVRMIMPAEARDYTRAMRALARRRARELGRLGLTGYVFKSRSPSCGVRDVRVLRRGGLASRSGVGLFAEVIRARLPHLPVEDEERLRDPVRLEAFAGHVATYASWQELERAGITRERLERFHATHGPDIAARSAAAERRMGRLVHERGRPVRDLARAYLDELSRAMRRPLRGGLGKKALVRST